MFSYLSGSICWYRDREEEKILASKEFKQKGFANFRKKDAQAFRDLKLKNKSVCFLHQAYRFRGKANYRDALYLSYGSDHSAKISFFINDLQNSLYWFLKVALQFLPRRMNISIWNDFKTDLKQNLQFNVFLLDYK